MNNVIQLHGNNEKRHSNTHENIEIHTHTCKYTRQNSQTTKRRCVLSAWQTAKRSSPQTPLWATGNVRGRPPSPYPLGRPSPDPLRGPGVPPHRTNGVYYIQRWPVRHEKVSAQGGGERTRRAQEKASQKEKAMSDGACACVPAGLCSHFKRAFFFFANYFPVLT